MGLRRNNEWAINIQVMNEATNIEAINTGGKWKLKGRERKGRG